MKELKAFWFRLPPQAQLFVVILVIIIVWFSWTYINAQKDFVKNQVRNKAEIDKLHDQGVKESYPISKYNQWANAMEKAMDGAGTSEDVVVKIFSYLKNDADVIQLEKAFGLRLSSYAASWLTDPTDLKDWLRSDLSEETIKQLNAQLSRQGITKKF